jgi:hypothetical protein
MSDEGNFAVLVFQGSSIVSALIVFRKISFILYESEKDSNLFWMLNSK